MGFNDNGGQTGNFAEQYATRRETHLTALQQKEEEMRQKFVIRVKEKESELKEAEREVMYHMCIGILLIMNTYNILHLGKKVY